MKRHLALLNLCLLAGAARSAVLVSIQDSNGVATLKYECTADEVVRSFALDVRVDKGRIVGISNFFRGESLLGKQGYGIFPAAFRDHVTVTSGANPDLNVSGYTPLAVVADSPGDTLPGLNSSGVTLEFGSLWDSSVPASVPPATGTLCTLQISEAAHVSVAANATRGGVVSATTGAGINPVFAGALVDPSVIITRIELAGRILTIFFQGGELETAPAVDGPWAGTGNSTGACTNAVGEYPARFYRVHRH